MNQQKRLMIIMERLEKEKSLTLQDIMQLTGVSRDTARRDTIKLTDSNLVIRTYGGISLANSFNKIDGYLGRTDQELQVKKQIAKEASKLLLKKQTVYLDVSTTISLLPQYLANRNINLAVTNSIDIADQFLKTTSIPTTILGGTLNRESRSVTGGYPIWELTKYRFDSSFLSCAGINNQGIYYAHEEDIAMKQAVREKSNKVVLLCDHTKINLSHNYLVYSFEEIDYLITDKKIPEELVVRIGKSKIIYTKENSYD
ncbi:DeoR/GlpR family DNA-binding transcription regulator [Enterococcus hirae]|uniref:DeoR/GlpR family DNA-binding transcription regulator n=2 Tax=Enterococcus hirae TaxID=1354 RepID=UPI002DB6ED38|nr:DeoR/GlpR family DNA-binding transcription regulator [Enterococcus hirae]MEB5907156.1 DeoR/GlpR family DNA-binding transcription regulator [Enterococcus hirae]